MRVQTIEPGVASLRISTDDAPYLDDASLPALNDAVAMLEADQSVRAVLVEGGARHFSAGANRGALLHPDALSKIARFCEQFPERLLRIPVPTVASMEGHAVGGGFLIGLWCDVAVLAAESLYGANFMELGFTPGMGSTRLLPEALGAPLARELLYTGRLVKGREIQQHGGPLAHAVVPRAEVRARALATARAMAEAPRESLVLLKDALSAGRREMLDRASEVERKMHRSVFQSPALRARIAERYASASPDGEGSHGGHD